MTRLLMVVAVLLVAAPAAAQTCTTGKRCGDTCIASNETCHVDENSGSSGSDNPYAWPVFCGGIVCGLGITATMFAALAAAPVVFLVVMRWAQDQDKVHKPRVPPPPDDGQWHYHQPLDRRNSLDLLEQE